MRLIEFYRFMWWNILLKVCDLGGRLLGDRWYQAYGCRVHHGAIVPFGPVPDWWWKPFGWEDVNAQDRESLSA